MVIHIPDEVLENELNHAFRRMSPISNINPGGKRKSSPVLHQVGYVICRTGNLCITMMFIYKAICNEIKKRGIIVYDSKTDTWMGVDYDGD